MNLARLARALVSGFVREESALALIVIGVRLAVFSYAGSPLPYYDQWVMEFNDTLMSIATGNGFSALVFRHNEHMMLTTKMLTLLGFYVNGYWDVSFLVICSATIRALTALVTFRFISGGAEPRTKLLLWFLCALDLSTRQHVELANNFSKPCSVTTHFIKIFQPQQKPVIVREQLQQAEIQPFQRFIGPLFQKQRGVHFNEEQSTVGITVIQSASNKSFPG